MEMKPGTIVTVRGAVTVRAIVQPPNETTQPDEVRIAWADLADRSWHIPFNIHRSMIIAGKQGRRGKAGLS
jgi:hypothetical protein